MSSPCQERRPLVPHDSLNTPMPRFRPTPPSPNPEPAVTYEHAQAVPGLPSTSTAPPRPSSPGPLTTSRDTPPPGPDPLLTSADTWRSPYVSLENSPSPMPPALLEPLSPPVPSPQSPPSPTPNPNLRTSQTSMTPSTDMMSSMYTMSPFNGDKKNYRTFIWQLNIMFIADAAKFDTPIKKILFALNQMKGGYAEEWANTVVERYLTDTTTLGTWEVFKARLD